MLTDVNFIKVSLTLINLDSTLFFKIWIMQSLEPLYFTAWLAVIIMCHRQYQLTL